MKRWFGKIWAKIVTQFGNIKVFRFPLFVIYDPSEYKMDGNHTRNAISMLQPGDVVLRGYEHYLDGYFINDPLSYSHGAIYVGDNTIIHAIAEGVSSIDVLDFMDCDRICILRPSSGQDKAIQKAKTLEKENVPYDFYFKESNSALYCFELCAKCYPNLGIKKMKMKKFFGLVQKDVYLSGSLRSNANFKVVFEYNPKHKIDTTSA